ncbi:MAG: germination protein YpeB [Candidatus Heteroscillospira sp.]|jgi:spore germination protein
MKNKGSAFLISVLCVALAVTGAMAWKNHRRAAALENALSISHHHAFAELVTGMTELDTALQKSLYAKSPTLINAVCTEVFGKAMTAQMSLGSLPFSTQELEKTAGFISRVGDYAYSLSRNGRSYTDQEAENLRSLAETASALAGNFRKLQTELAEGGLSMDELLTAERRMDEAEESAVPDDTLGGGMRLIEEEFPEMPSLLYDGPFSQHIKDAEPKLLAGEKGISERSAQEAAAKFLSLELDELQSMGSSRGKIPCYYFSSGDITIEVTQRGGRIMNFISAYQPGDARMSAEDAVGIAKKFLSDRGYENMEASYHMTEEGVCTINFAYKQGEVLCYPDLVKVSVALDRGMVVGFESAGYISSHTQRELPKVQVSREEAQKQVGELSVESFRQALIPTAGGYEKLCHEFVCADGDGGQFIIYVNAETGEQEKIMILLEDENGSLTM